VWDIIIESVLWNSSARVEKNPGTDPAVQGEFITQGNVTEQGLLKFFMHDIRGQGILDKKALLDNQLLQVIQFTSSRKKASVVVKTANGVRVYTKGAPDMLFPCIANVLTNDGIVDKNA
jgi:Ca2+-transporting ATPase